SIAASNRLRKFYSHKLTQIKFGWLRVVFSGSSGK
ncbi:MAG: hypothetical protein ACI9KN_001445, partial [Gammaproteobacteria bacterium]